MSYQTTSPWFRSLDSKEEAEFRAWARKNFKPGQEIDPIWHPIVREECMKMNQEAQC